MKFQTTIHQQEEALEVNKKEKNLLSRHSNYIVENANKNAKYLIKTNEITHSGTKDPEFSYYLEVLAARFYKFFSLNTITADTAFFVRDDGTVNIASKWVENFIPYDYGGLPYVSGDKIVIKIDGEEKEVHGYLEMLLIARLLGNFDCIGKGVNAGYIIDEEGGVRNVKIDPGGSFPFVDNNLFNVIFGPVLHINQRIANKYLKKHKDDPDFHTDIPLEMIDHNDPLELDKDFNEINELLDYYYPELDTRDLLIESIRYQDIINSPSLRQILSELVYKIVSINEEQLRSLIYDDMPVEINGEDLLQIKSVVLENMMNRRTAIYKLYMNEFKFYREQLTTHKEITLNNEPLIQPLDKEILVKKSMKILENLIDHIFLELSEHAIEGLPEELQDIIDMIGESHEIQLKNDIYYSDSSDDETGNYRELVLSEEAIKNLNQESPCAKNSFEKFCYGPLANIANTSHLADAHHSSSKADKKDKSSATTSTNAGKQQGSSSGVQPKTDKAAIDKNSIDSGYYYINLATQKVAEFLFILPSATASSKTKAAAPKNEEREEYNQAKQEVEKNSNNVASVSYENFSIIEKSTNKTQTTYYKSGQELMDIMLTLESGGIPGMLGEEGGTT